MLQQTFIFVLTLCSFMTTSIAKPIEIVEVIQILPTEASPTWQIGSVAYAINSATVIDTDHIPVVGNLAIVTYNVTNDQNVATEIIPLSIIETAIIDGPYIFFDTQGQLSIVSIQNNRITKTELPHVDGTRYVSTNIPSVPNITIATRSTLPPPDTFCLPPKLLAISDIEGNLDHLIQFLQFHRVIDTEYNWAWGVNHLLFNGDSVDRGDHVTELLWFIRKVQQQAIEAGGNVHFVLGNHEAMILANDIRYTHPKYKFVAERLGIPYHQLFSERSVLGDWMRKQNSVVQVGPYIFTHAGYGPELNALHLSKKQINTSIRNSLGHTAWPERTDLATSLAWHSKGPLWYRGYFEKHSEKYGPKPTDEELDAILDRHQAKAIIVGHTVTGTIGWLDGDKRLIGIDVHWDTPGEGQGLLIVGDKLIRVTMTTSNRELVDIPTGKE